MLTRAQERIYRKTYGILEEYVKKLRDANAADGEAAFGYIKDWFEAYQDELEKAQEDGGRMLEYAFDFMEESFGNGQEMVIFITELNNDFYSVKFLQEYECERYYRYNKELLFDESGQSIEKRLQELGR